MISPIHNKKIQLTFPSWTKSALQQGAYFLASLLLSRTVIIGDFSPFGTALCATVHPRYLISALVGSSLGSFLSPNTLSPFRYLGSVIGASLLSWAIFSFCERGARRILPPLNAFACSLFTGVALCFATGFALDTFLLYFAESVLCGGTAYFFNRAFFACSKGHALKAMPLSNLAPVLISVAISLMSLSFLTIGKFSILRMVCVLCILLAARYTSLTGGVLVGTALGMTMGLSSGNMLLAGTYGFSGFMAGFFSALGQVGTASAFTLSSVLMLVLSADSVDLFPLLVEIAVATLLFLLLPSKLCNKIDKYLNSKIDVSPSGSLRNSLVVKLRFAGSAMNGVSQSVNSVNHKLRELSIPEYGGINKNLAAELCATCNLKTLCWKKETALTISGFNSLWQVARENGSLTLDNLPTTIGERCIHTDKLIHCYNHHYQSICQKESFENSVGNLREIVADQLGGISDMLFDLSTEFEEAEIYDLETAEKVKLILATYGIFPRDVSCVTDKYHRLRIEAHCPQPLPNLNNRKLHAEVAHACGRHFEDVNVTFAGHEALLTYCEKARLSLLIGTAQHASGGGQICGDSLEVINDGKGHQVLLLSDGMGTGVAAAMEGALASGMLARLVKAGFGFDCSLRTVNSALLVKSGEESLATLDVVSVDLFNGKTEFYKAGASSSFVMKEGKVLKVELPSLPAGILREIEFAKTATILVPDDTLILFSDGIADSDTQWLKQLLESCKRAAPQQMADYILKTALARRTSTREDDMTVLVARVQRAG